MATVTIIITDCEGEDGEQGQVSFEQHYDPVLDIKDTVTKAQALGVQILSAVTHAIKVHTVKGIDGHGNEHTLMGPS